MLATVTGIAKNLNVKWPGIVQVMPGQTFSCAALLARFPGQWNQSLGVDTGVVSLTLWGLFLFGPLNCVIRCDFNSSQNGTASPANIRQAGIDSIPGLVASTRGRAPSMWDRCRPIVTISSSPHSPSR